MRNKLTKFLTSECPPKGMRQFAKTWKYAACMLLAFILGIGQMWAEDVTWEGPYGNFVSKKLSDEETTVTIEKSSSNSSKLISCIKSSNQSYLSLNGGGKYLKFVAPEGYEISNIKLIWMSGAADQALPVLFGESISAVGTVESKDKAVTITKGGFKMTNQIATSAGTNCDSPDDIALPSGTKQVMIGRSGAYSIANYTIGEVEETVKFRLAGASGSYFTTAVGAESTPFLGRVTLTVVPVCTAPTDPAITGTTAYDEGDDISLTATAASGITGSTTYAWYKGDTWDAASAGSSIGSTATLTINTCATTDAGTYWCKISNGTCFVTASSAITVEASAAPEHNITYSNTKGAANTNPATYKEGIGVTSFAPLADVTDFHFNGWSPSSISDTEDQDVEVEAQWVAAYNVTFSAGTGSGTVPATFQKWDGAKFNLPGQGSMVAPSGKVFDGWKANGTGDKLAANAEYTMGAAEVEFVAQWKAVPVVLFYYQQSNLSSNLAAGTYPATGGTITTSADMSKESASYNAKVPTDMKGGANVGKLGSTAAYIQLTLTTGNFLEGDTVYICGYKPYMISTSSSVNGDIASSITTGSAKGDYNVGYAIIPAGVEQNSIYLSRAEGTGTGFAAVKVIRPAQKDVKSTVVTLTDVKVKETSISASDLATLVSAHSVDLSNEEASAPTITFNKHTVITYVDDTYKATDTPIEVTATNNGAGKWTASATIEAVTYTVTLNIVTGFTVTYNGSGNEGGTVPVDDVRHDAGTSVTVLGNTGSLTKTLGGEPAAFHGWNTNSDMASGTHYDADETFNMPSNDVTLYAVWGFNINYNLDGGTINESYPTWYISTGATSTIATALPTDVTRDGYTFDGWYAHNGVGAKLTEINASYTGNFEGEWALKAVWIPSTFGNATSIDFEKFIDDNTTGGNWATYLLANNFDISSADGVTLDAPSGKPADKGLKIKHDGTTLTFKVEGGKLVTLKNGVLSGAQFSVDNGANYATLTGATGSTGESVKTYYYDANDATYIFKTTTGSYNIIQSIKIENPYVVTYDATTNGGEAVTPGSATFTGTALTLPAAVKGSETFIGWFTAATDGEKIGEAGASYTPTADITLYAQFEAVSSDARLNSITFSNMSGTLAPAFDKEVTSYTYTMPYGTVDVPTVVSAIPSDAVGGSWYIESAAAAWGETTIVRGKAASNDTKAYNITMQLAPKDGVSIFKAVLTSPTEATYSGLYVDATNSEIKLADDPNGYKFASKTNYIKMALDGGTFQTGDILHMSYQTNPQQGELAIYDNTTKVAGTAYTNHTLEFPVDANGLSTLYIRRTDDNKFNGWVTVVNVTRVMNPVLTKVTIAGVEATPDNTNHITMEVSASATLSDLNAATYEWISNSDAWTSAHTPSVANEWAFGVENTLTFTDKDGDATVYYITVNQAAASTNVELATLTVNGNTVIVVPGQAAYDYELPYGTSAAPTVAATAEDANATLGTITQAASATGSATFTVTAEDGTTYRDYTINFSVSKWAKFVIWDASTMDAVTTSGTDPYSYGLTWETTGFDGLKTAYVDYKGATKSEIKTWSSGGSSTGNYIQIDVPAGCLAKIYVAYASNSSDSERGLSVSKELAKNPTTSYYAGSSANRTTIAEGLTEILGQGTYYLNPTNAIGFYEVAVYLRPGCVRDDDWMAPGELGTICQDHNIAFEDIQGATFYELAGKDPVSGKIAFDEITSGQLDAGVPYVFQSNSNKIILFYGNETVAAPVDKHNGMYGTFVYTELTGDALEGVYYFAGHALWSCTDLTELKIAANRAYVKVGEIGELNESNPAPGRRRITFGVNGQNAATGIGNVQGDEVQSTKVLINGQLFILRGEKMYDATGRMVK